jgi:hypothetical protein
MPFQGYRRYTFTETSILQNALRGPGVYGISNAGRWLFVGSDDNVQAALLRHLKQPGSALLSNLPTGFVFEPCDSTTHGERQSRLIAELAPRCNRG